MIINKEPKTPKPKIKAPAQLNDDSYLESEATTTERPVSLCKHGNGYLICVHNALYGTIANLNLDNESYYELLNLQNRIYTRGYEDASKESKTC